MYPQELLPQLPGHLQLPSFKVSRKSTFSEWTKNDSFPLLPMLSTQLQWGIPFA